MASSERNMLTEIVEREVPCEGSWCAEGGPVGVTCMNHRRRAACLAVAKAVAAEALTSLWLEPAGYCRACGIKKECAAERHARKCGLFRKLYALAAPASAEEWNKR